MKKKILPLMLLSMSLTSIQASEIGSLPRIDDGDFTFSVGYYSMRSEWGGLGDAQANRIIEDVERDAPFMKIGYEFMEDWYVSGLFGFEKIKNDVTSPSVSSVNAGKETFFGLEVKGSVYQKDKLSIAPFMQYISYADYSIFGPIYSNGFFNNVDAELSDFYTATAGVMGQQDYGNFALYGGLYYMHSEVTAKGIYGQLPIDVTLENESNLQLLLGVNVPFKNNYSVDFETHYSDDISYAITFNYYPFKVEKKKIVKPEIVEPKAAVVKQPVGPTEFENQIYFSKGSTDVAEAEYPKIKALARFLLKRPDSDVIIEGHCDCFGDEEFNQKLSEQRAQSVKKLLINLYNISEDQILLVGYGESFPIADNTTKEGRQKNRRVRVYAIE